MAEKTQQAAFGGLLMEYFHWLTLLLASCSPAELASSSGCNSESK